MSFTGETLSPPAIAPNYEPMDRQTEAALINEALSQNPEIMESKSEFALLTLGGNSPFANVARSLECTVFNERFKNTPNDMTREYGPYEEASTFFLLIDRENSTAAGVCRVISPNPEGFKSLEDIVTTHDEHTGQKVTELSPDEICNEFGLDQSNMLDVATIAARPGYGASARNGDPIVLASLMRALYIHSHEHGVNDLVAIIDGKPHETLKDAGVPINHSSRIIGPFGYLGAEKNYFIHIPVPEVEQSVRNVDDTLFEFTFGNLELGGRTKLSFREQ